ncbi:exopolyphosphatase / guanosine-5'-triphosphate,3'-diphosphate pyrophosphatase [Ekhidna lutea]|uniref:Exopolyphosphatase / guanosine-5'-triphosphate,3'-diphosphate pyrophosphatase n=1 Tax=Ekhidna lutea TaxID=447679 RepID=A0A239M8V0_EKHLU|nr:phosphatase [Ekhidna lutea]SNT39091.1 exopolyphosphatase / guanosine-5'-triphosphate,3'-diphosphate pyrophosphatase [Ekhidna lutea]
MKLAAIDIGSNAVRLQITRVLEYEKMITFKKLEYVRFPLRLGHDVFSEGRISDYNEERFFKLMTAYKNLIDLYEIDAYYGCATSAMRESENGKEIVDRVRKELGIDLQIISGEDEAEMINKVILQGLDNDHYIHIDVGGGSTELNIYENHQKVYSKSFKLGSVRILEGKDTSENWGEMWDWVSKYAFKKGEKITAIGTGGNINKLFELSNPEKKTRKMSLNNLMRTQDILKNLTLDDRLNKLQLNPDRADVIVPASDIYIEVMKAAKAKSIIVPDVGLKDGINYHLYQTHHPESEKVFVKN